MNKSLLLCLLLSTSVFAHEEGDHEKKTAMAPVEVTDAGSVYGERMPAPLPAAVSIDAAAADVATHSGKLAAFSGRITEVCQKMGCWLVLAGENGQLARVSMHDHAFGIPKDSSGPAIVYGTLSEAALSESEIEHLKKDGAAKPALTELRIDALSVLIPRSG
jgi:hypothetical protein